VVAQGSCYSKHAADAPVEHKPAAAFNTLLLCLVGTCAGISIQQFNSKGVGAKEGHRTRTLVVVRQSDGSTSAAENSARVAWHCVSREECTSFVNEAVRRRIAAHERTGVGGVKHPAALLVPYEARHGSRSGREHVLERGRSRASKTR
jgi:hypothetical protein